MEAWKRLAVEENPKHGRIQFIYGIIFFFMSTLVLRLGYLQIVNGEDFRAAASTTMLARLPILPSRGRIYDANHQLLAYDQPSFSIVLTRLNTRQQNYRAMAAHLGPVFHRDEADLVKLMETKDPGSTQVRLLPNATPEQVAFVAEHQSWLPGLHVVEDPKRAYRYGSLAGHVIGYVHPIPADEAAEYSKKGYLLDQWIGLDGVERSYESVLQGRAGERVLALSSMGVPKQDLGVDPSPVPGDNIELTLDAHLQATAQQIVVDELNQVKQKYHYDPQDAEAVLLDTHTGGVLTLVSYPYYDPGWYTTSAQYEAHEDYLNSRLTPMINHALLSPRTPGSTVKPINILVGLKNGVIDRYTTIDDRGYAVVGNFKMKDWQPWGHGKVGPITAIAESCDTFMYDVGMWLSGWHDGPPVGERVGRWIVWNRIEALDKLYDADAAFGLGPETHIDLPYEARGHYYDNLHLYDPQAAKRALKTRGYYDDRGTLYDVTAAAIGQNQQFTPIQLATYVLALANEGHRLQPHVLHRVLSPKGKVLRDVEAIDRGRVPFDPQDIALVRRGMWAAVNRPGGTAHRAFLGAPYEAAGKTGTAQIERDREISLFIGYAPAEHPEVCVAVMVPGGGESGETAVPIARKLFDAYFREHHEYFPQAQWTDRSIPQMWPTDHVLLTDR